MSIYTLFTKEEQMDILWRVRRIKQKYEQNCTPKKRQFYFTEFANEDYRLVERLEEQVRKNEKGLLNTKDLTTNIEIADLFSVRISAVDDYLRRCPHNGEIDKRRVLCLQKGRTNGWNYLQESGKVHKLTKEDTTKPKKYNGRKKRNNQNTKTS